MTWILILDHLKILQVWRIYEYNIINGGCSDSKWGSCISWNPTSPRKAHEDVLIRSDLPLMCRSLFPHCCVLWRRTKPWRVWALKRTISTQLKRRRYKWYQSHALARSMGPACEDMCIRKGVDGSDPKEGSCIPWNPTSPGEANDDGLIKSDFPFNV